MLRPNFSFEGHFTENDLKKSLADYNAELQIALQENRETLQKDLAKYLEETYRNFDFNWNTNIEAYQKIERDIVDIMNKWCALLAK